MEAQNDHDNSSDASNTRMSASSSSSSSAINAVVNISRYFKFPPGYRFRPSDKELVMDYLGRKLRNERLPPNNMVVVDLYSNNPKYFAETYKELDMGEENWYFFTPRRRKYPNGNRPNRSTGDGYWKASGAGQKITHEGNIIGFKRSLVFYTGQYPNGERTNWMMYEYRVNEPPRAKEHENDMKLDDVLCRIHENTEDPPQEDDNGDEYIETQDFESNRPNSLHSEDNITYDVCRQEIAQGYTNELPNTEESNEIYNNLMGNHQNNNLGPSMAPQSSYSLPQNNAMPIESDHLSKNYLEDVVQYYTTIPSIVPDHNPNNNNNNQGSVMNWDNNPNIVPVHQNLNNFSGQVNQLDNTMSSTLTVIGIPTNYPALGAVGENGEMQWECALPCQPQNSFRRIRR